MSDIIIKGMDYPKSCDECQLLEGDLMDGLCHGANRWLDDDDWLWTMDEDGIIDDDKPVNCPLVEIPSGHGRLIDGDRLLKTLDETAKEFISDTQGNLHIDYIADEFNDAPTILDAEGGE